MSLAQEKPDLINGPRDRLRRRQFDPLKSAIPKQTVCIYPANAG